MCGIVGIFTYKNEYLQEKILLQMRNSIRHRGPDDSGLDIIAEDGVALAHVRLSILDLTSAGHQPMWSLDKSAIIVYNGEVYNFPEIRSELELLGYKFKSHCDTEVIIAGYQAWGIDVVNKLNGMFAFAIWDRNLKKLWLVRDRLGVKPLYYYFDSAKSILIFASEIKAILQHPAVSKTIDNEGLQSYFALGYIVAPLTIFKEIKKLPSAHILIIEHGQIPTIKRYWDLTEVATLTNISQAELKTNVRYLFEQAVKRRLISDVPLGAFLSGGVDSTLVVGIMNQFMQDSVQTFSIAYDLENNFSNYNLDADYADQVAAHFKTKHTRLVIAPQTDVVNNIRRYIRTMDEPHENSNGIAALLLCEKVKQEGITVILNGDGSDDMFAGYWHYQDDFKISLLQKIPNLIRNSINLNQLKKINKFKNLVTKLRQAEIPKFTPSRLIRYPNFSLEAINNFLTPEYRVDSNIAYQSIETIISNLIDNNPSINNVDVMLYLDMMQWIPEENNMKFDKTSMAVGLEARSPFLDYQLVEYVMSIPFTKKAGLGRPKWLLKAAFSDLLPEIVTKRPKLGWMPPIDHWLKQNSWNEVCRLIDTLPATGIFKPEVRNFTKIKSANISRQIWSLLTFAIWYEEYLS